MAAGIELAESGRVVGIALEFPGIGSSSPGKVPKRIRERLLETKAPLSAEDIESKLKGADLRRQQFHEWLSSKARPKPRSPSWSSQDEDLGQRLEAKLHAAQQKRLNILMEAQVRLARLDELRKAAKTGVEMRFEKEREELGTKVESRVQQAELNRMLLLEAHRQRKALAQERTAKSLSRRMIQEKKLKECMYASICQKRASAEKKRLGLLEAEKTRARARVLEARRVANSVYHQREIQRRRMRDQLEDRLQRAKWQRAEYLRQRRSPRCASHCNRNKMYRHGDFLSRKLARCWKQFLKSRKTTFALAKAHEALEINEKSVKLMPFEQLAFRIESVSTIQAVKALLERLENRFKVSQTSAENVENIDHLLKRLASPPKRSRVARRGPNKDTKSSQPNNLSRYPARLVLCAYMILGHPDAVFSGQGEREVALAEAALKFIREFELLIKIILEGSWGQSSIGSSRQLSSSVMFETHKHQKSSLLPNQRPFRSQLAAFDAAWRSYLYCFVVWKVKDARSLEEDLVRAACQLELSMIQKCKITPEGESSDLTHDLKAIKRQVSEDQKLLRDKVLHLSGNAGVERMESALLDARAKFFETQESRSAMLTPPTNISCSTSSSSIEPDLEDKKSVEDIGKSSRVVRALFKDDSSQHKVGVNPPGENIVLVNEVVHEGPQAFAEDFGGSNEFQNDIKAKIRETMERAFWDSIMDSIKLGEQPDYERIVELVKEMRDELCEIAPHSWKQDIQDTLDIGIFSQVLKSGIRDTGYLGRILEYALITLQKLSAPAKTSEMEKVHKNFLNELSELVISDDKTNNSFIIAAIKAVRFVLEQTQVLKREISKARTRMMQYFIKGAAGFEYLQKAFADHYGHPSGCLSSLPRTMQWFGSLKDSVQQEWQQHIDLLSDLMPSGGSFPSSSQGLHPAVSLRAGGAIPLASNWNTAVSHPMSIDTGDKYPECKGEKVDLFVRLGLLKLACGVEGVTEESLPETHKLNVFRLRAVQSQLQKIIVISTSMLILRQLLLTENPNPLDVDTMISDTAQRLLELLDSSPDVGFVQIIDAISNQVFSKGCDEGKSGVEKLQSKKEMISSLLLKSLRAEDAIFLKVSHAMYVAARGVVLSGSSTHGRELAEKALRRVGAVVLLDRLEKAVQALTKMAVVSVQVHRQWYAFLIDNV
ncbi:hypothetical protein H6P81_014049 [Aristolochia fimbriata]|uniref:T-complex protein 11 n=1 Tax=Aristolochia fimbriata TaxID=158543 RepID=A0AAV7EHL1_ARIFI|nr:hypothetical protein H6P81_014049 [Aristolochia fimbriata]